jgi:hypothetical protein
VGLFRRQDAGASSPLPAAVDPSLSDQAWLAASEQQFRERIEGFYGSPETMASGGREHYGNQDFGTAMFFFAKSIDMLHSAYGFGKMRDRQPSPADIGIVDGFVSSLGLSLQMHPNAEVDACVREVTHRLRSISTECDRAGLSSTLYRNALNSIASSAPNVRTDDIYWS